MGHTIAHIMLYGDGAVLVVNLVGIGALDGKCLLAGHLGLEVRVLAETLPDARPAGVAAKVHDRGEHPRHTCGTGLIGHGLAHHAGIFPVESCGQVHLLRIEGTVRQVSGAVNHVKAVDARNADFGH